jgi:hypothetical protein
MLARICAVIVLFCGSAAGASQIYHSRFDFLEAIGPHRLFTFEVANGFPAAPAPLSAIAEIGLVSNKEVASLQPHPIEPGNQVLTGTLKSEVPYIEPLTFQGQFETQFIAIGFDIVDLGEMGTELVSISVSGFGRGPTLLFNVEDNDGNRNTPVFWGIVHDQPIRELTITAEDPRCDRPTPCYTSNSVDNLVLVPEPSIALFLPFAALFLRRRNKTPHQKYGIV